MKIGSNCFCDASLKSIVSTLNNLGECDITHLEKQYIYDTEINNELVPYLEQILEIFSPVNSLTKKDDIKQNSDYVYNILEKWNIFSVPAKDIKKILIAICSSKFQDDNRLFSEKVMIPEILNDKYMEEYSILKTNSWQDFCYDIKHRNRFHSAEINTNQLKELLKFFELKFSENTLSLFRARVCDSSHYDIGFQKDDDLKAPPEDIATAGRINSAGVPCLYLANSEVTTYHEVRARIYDHITVGQFINIKSLKIIDLSNLDTISPFNFEDIDFTWFAINIESIRQIAKEITRPMRRFDKEIDYIPTQYISDYIKSLGYDGIKYKSTLNADGINYAIFNTEKFECINKKQVNVENISFEIKNI